MSFTLSVKCWSVFLWSLHPVKIVGLYYCVSYTVCQGLVCVLISLTPCTMGCLFLCVLKKVSEYDQEIPQSQTADNPVAPRGRAAQPSEDTRKTN